MSTKSEMAPHMRKAVEEIDGDIAQLQQDIERLRTTRSTIVELYGGETNIPETPEELPITKRKYKKRGGGGQAKETPGTAAPISTGRMDANTIGLLANTRLAAEPFTVASLRVSSGFEVKFISNKLFVWMKKGWLQKAGRGEYSRTKDFPAAAPETE